MIQLISFKLLHSIKRIEDLVSGKQQKQFNECTAAFGNVEQCDLKSKESAFNQDEARFTVVNELDKKWVLHVRKIQGALCNLDKHKYLEPKFSQSFFPIMKFLQKRCGSPNSSIANMSIFSSSQRGGGPGTAFGALQSNFNDGLSLNSFLSQYDTHTQGSNNSVPSQNVKIKSFIAVDDQKEVIQRVPEQAVEEEDDEIPKKIKNKQKVNGQTPQLMTVTEPVLRMRSTSRTNIGFKLLPDGCMLMNMNDDSRYAKCTLQTTNKKKTAVIANNLTQQHGENAYKTQTNYFNQHVLTPNRGSQPMRNISAQQAAIALQTLGYGSKFCSNKKNLSHMKTLVDRSRNDANSGLVNIKTLKSEQNVNLSSQTPSVILQNYNNQGGPNQFSSKTSIVSHHAKFEGIYAKKQQQFG